MEVCRSTYANATEHQLYVQATLLASSVSKVARTTEIFLLPQQEEQKKQATKLPNIFAGKGEHNVLSKGNPSITPASTV